MELGGALESNIEGPVGLWDAAVAPEHAVILYGIMDFECESGERPGLYLQSIPTKTKKYLGVPDDEWRLDTSAGRLIMWHEVPALFEVFVPGQGIAIYSPEGELEFSAEDAVQAEFSPDGQLVALVLGDDRGLGERVILRSLDGLLFQELPEGQVEGVVWFAGSEGFFVDYAHGVFRFENSADWEGLLVPGVESILEVVVPTSTDL